MPDFRSAERCFSLVTQVSGRAGRFFPDGKVIVQSFNPSRPAIALSCAARAEEFYAAELEARKTLGFPPFSRLIRLVFRSANKETAERACAEAAQWMRGIGLRTEDGGMRSCKLGVMEFSRDSITHDFNPQSSILNPQSCEILGPAERTGTEAAQWRDTGLRTEDRGMRKPEVSESPAQSLVPRPQSSILNPQSCEILGPAECPLAKVAANYRMQVLLRGKSLSALRRLAGEYLRAVKTPAGVYVEIDVDPVSLL
jgi:primosomal protein N'